jgi:hypothetical protein
MVSPTIQPPTDLARRRLARWILCVLLRFVNPFPKRFLLSRLSMPSTIEGRFPFQDAVLFKSSY